MSNQRECRNGRNGRNRFRFQRGCGRNHAGTCTGQNRLAHTECMLRDLYPGDTAVVTNIVQESGFRKKLLSLGMIPGSRIECVRGGNDSGTCIRLGSSIFMINSHMADLVQVARV
jgi:Fe2+ transport system protein FeoA